MSSPSFKPRTSTTAAGKRTARLLPHLATCMEPPFCKDIRESIVYLLRHPLKAGHVPALLALRTSHRALALSRLSPLAPRPSSLLFRTSHASGNA
jgi:hypothetical protein